MLADGTEDVAYTVTEAQLLEGWADAGTAMLTVSGLTSSSGTVTANSDGSFTITPVANATGPVTLTYGVSDGTQRPGPRDPQLLAHGGERRAAAHRHPGDAGGRHGRHRLHRDGGPAA